MSAKSQSTLEVIINSLRVRTSKVKISIKFNLNNVLITKENDCFQRSIRILLFYQIGLIVFFKKIIIFRFMLTMKYRQSGVLSISRIPRADALITM